MRLELLGLALLVSLPAPGLAQAIDHTKVRRYSGEEVAVQGPVARAANAGGGTVWLSLGKPHPNATLVIVISAALAPALGDLRHWEGATIEVFGRILTGETGGIGIDPTIAGALRTGAPKTPYLVLGNMSRLRIVEPAPEPPEPAKVPPPR